MNILYYLGAAFFVLGMLSTIAMVDKPRDPISGGAACIIVIINCGFVYLMINAARVL